MPGPDSAPVVAVMATALAGVLLIFVLLFALDAVIWERWMVPQVVGDTERVREMMETDGYCWTWWGGMDQEGGQMGDTGPVNTDSHDAVDTNTPENSADSGENRGWHILRILLLYGCVAPLLVLWSVAALYFTWLFIVDLGPDEVAPFEEIRAGMSEKQVRERVGSPDIVYSADDAPEDYYIPGYAHEPRQITNRVLIWEGIPAQVPMGWYVVYVYIGPAGRVEHVFIGQD